MGRPVLMPRGGIEVDGRHEVARAGQPIGAFTRETVVRQPPAQGEGQLVGLLAGDEVLDLIALGRETRVRVPLILGQQARRPLGGRLMRAAP